MASKRINKELKDLQKDSPTSCSAANQILPLAVLLSGSLLFRRRCLVNDPSNSKDVKKAERHNTHGNMVGIRIVIICLGLVAGAAFSVFLFKIWQKKKREEQHAHLLSF